MSSSDYILSEAKSYALYTLQNRAIPHIADGLKSGARRVLWCARDGAKYKSATLAGLAVPLHPHAPPEDSIDSSTGPYVNNIPLFEGFGVFGTLIKPTAYGASRYTSVKVSKFTQDVLFRDIEVVPMISNYDGTLMEPKHFLPLSPIAIMNPCEGVAVGFATDILPRTFRDIVESQLEYLNGKKVKERFPHFQPTQNPALERQVDKKGVVRWLFSGEYKTLNSSEVRVTKLPYGVTHEKFVEDLYKYLEHEDAEKRIILDVTDASKDKINILIKFKRGFLTDITTEELENILGISVPKTENLNLIDFDGLAIKPMNYVSVIEEFTDWRFGWYVDRYMRLLDLIKVDIQRYDDILLSIKKNVAGISKKTADRAELKDFIESIGVVYVDYIADLPIYRFTEEEARKVEEKRAEALKTKQDYEDILADDERRKGIYISELKEVLKKYGN